MSNNDDAFAKFAADQSAKEEKRQKALLSGGGKKIKYDDINWTGLVSKKMKIFRAIGGVPGSDENEFTARVVRIAETIDDEGHKIRLVIPEKDEDPNHIAWKILSRVNKYVYADDRKTKIYPAQEKYPELFNRVNFDGLDEQDKQARYKEGIEGKRRVLMNVIDREQMAWHREHKKTMVLSKNINETEYEGKPMTFVDPGVPEYGFLSRIYPIFKTYKDWRKYDLSITRTGSKENPYEIRNASKYIEEVEEELRPLVSMETDLTDEEKSWVSTDLKKCFQYSNHTKWLTRMGKLVKLVDALYGDHLYDELQALSEKEQKEWKEKYGDDAITAETPKSTVAPKPSTIESTAPATRPVAQKVEEPKVNTFVPGDSKGLQLLANPEVLTEAEKATIITVNMVAGKPVAEYIPNVGTVYSCSHGEGCEFISPDSFHACPNCGKEFK